MPNLSSPLLRPQMDSCFASSSFCSSLSSSSTSSSSSNSASIQQPQTEQVFHYKYLKEFRVEQCPLFLQHKCQQHRPFTCFHWHFQNQRRRRPVRRRDGIFTYSADAYCTKYDETTGICPDGDDCPLLHRTAGDTERRYHLKYYKTGMCVHDTDNRGFCVKNGPHCAFAHGANDLRPPVYDIRELKAIENGDCDPVTGLNSLDKERNLVNDDPKWLDTTFVLANYKTEACKKPPRLCRQGYACPQFHNNKDKRRSPKKYKYRSTPCPQVKSGDEWGDPSSCDSGDSCQYCHTRTEQQFHPEIYKSTKCNDIQNTSYCPRGAFCAFAHVEQETVSLDSPPPDSVHRGRNFGEMLSQYIMEDKAKNGHELQADHMSHMFGHRAPGAQLRNGSLTPPFEENGIASPIDATSSSSSSELNNNSINLNNLHLMDTNNANNNNAFAKNRFLSGDQARRARQQVYSLGSALEDLNVDPFFGEGNKSRKSSGFSDGSVRSNFATGNNKVSKSRNCSGESSLSQQTISGIMTGTNPEGIPGKSTPTGQQNGGASPTNENGLENKLLGMPQLGLFDLTSSPPKVTSTDPKDLEISRLKEEMCTYRARMANFEENYVQARQACEAWKKETALATKKAELALREKEVALSKIHAMLIEGGGEIGGGPYLHAVKRVADLNGLPNTVLKTIEWKLKRDLVEVENARRLRSDNGWLTSSSSNLFDLPPSTLTSNGSDGWGAIMANQRQIFGSMAQQ